MFNLQPSATFLGVGLQLGSLEKDVLASRWIRWSRLATTLRARHGRHQLPGRGPRIDREQELNHRHDRRRGRPHRQVLADRVRHVEGHFLRRRARTPPPSYDAIPGVVVELVLNISIRGLQYIKHGLMIRLVRLP